MNSHLEHLVTLQAIDLEIKHLRAELAEAPKRIARVAADLREAETSLARLQTSLREEEALRRRQGSDADDHRSKLTRLRKQMDAASSAAQIAALQHEITFAETTITTLEDEELASLERSEANEAKLSTEEGLVQRLTELLDRVKQETAAAEVRLHETLAAREAERTELRATIDESALANYDRVAKARGTGISEALDHKCSACQMMVRPQRWNDLTGHEHDDQIFTCETCGRMLFWDPRRDAPQPWPPGDRLKAASQPEGRA